MEDNTLNTDAIPKLPADNGKRILTNEEKKFVDLLSDIILSATLNSSQKDAIAKCND